MSPPLVQLIKPARKMAVLATEEVRQLFVEQPELTVRGIPYRLLEHGQYETALLQRLGYPVPSPMRTYYAYPAPSDEPAFETQKVTTDLLTLNERAYVLNDMGTGKTRSALWAWDWLKCQGLSQKLLIVCTRSIMRSAWQAEVFRTIRHRKVAVLYGRKTSNRQERLAQLASDADIYIINHDGVKTIYKELMERTDIDAIVLDELATYRNGGTGRSKDMAKLARTKKFVWGLTGSPMPQAPTDVWAQGRIVTPQNTPKYFSHLRDQMMERVAPNIYKPKAGAVGIAYQIMQPSVRFTLGDVVELPDITYRNVAIDMSPEQSRVYNEIVRHCKTLVQEQQITAFNAGIAMNKLVQIAGGWVYSQDKTVAKLDAAPRLRALVDAVNSTARKVIVFAPYISTLGGISEALKTDKIPHEVIHGKTKDRDRIFYEFQHENKFKVLVAHPRTMAHGLTLTEADTIIWFLPIMSYEIYEQANARIRRVGQKHKQQIIHFVASPVERRIYSLLRGKQTMQDKFLSLLEEGTLSNGTTS